MKAMRRWTITIPASGSYDFSAAGDFVFVESASVDLLLDVLNIGDGGTKLGDQQLVRRAVSHKYRSLFDKLTLTGAAGTAVVLWTGEGESNLNLISGSVTIASGGTFDSSADATITAASSLDFAADSTRMELHLQPASTNTGDLCVRDQSATTSEGIRINPAALGFYVVSCAGAHRIRNNSGATQVLQYAEVKA